MLRLRALTFILVGMTLAGCTSVQKWSDSDPLEGFNRKMFWVNQKLDRNAALPAAVFYKSSVPGDFRDGLHNVLTNVGLPIVFANDVLQGEFHRAGKAAARFGVNTTIGVLGVTDRASDMGFPEQHEDFGQTLGVYGVPGGPYVVLPLLGSALPRDWFGRIYVDHYFSPLSYFDYSGRYYVSLGVRVFSTVDGRARVIDDLHDIERSSVDYYAAMRDVYLKRRQDQIDNRTPQDLESIAN
ncbi:MAG TPA: VacJ family lipoprotein [Rhizomicrobium sp.]|jgi:phospholipid-binding lipoprotein MlaA|nr:VacJ family lipoprotein [Rhizomicrobium sp.]